jgi:acetyl esterase
MSLLADRLAQARMIAGRTAVDGFFQSASRLARLHPLAKPEAHRVEVIRDVPYQSPRCGGVVREHLLDVWRPIEGGGPARRPTNGPMPIVLYLHGGGFRILSKDTHWIMALSFARRGYLVFSINYRLAPAFPFPAAMEDAAAALAWVKKHAHRYDGDLRRLVVAGESAGANLAASLTAASCLEPRSDLARRIFDAELVPVATLPACGILQVSDTARFGRRRPLPSWLTDRLIEVETSYLRPPGADGERGAEGDVRHLADPLLMLESDAVAVRPLPPFFAPVGTKDPLLDDTRRLGAALAKRGVRCDTRYYPGEVHAFHAFVWRAHAKACWNDTFTFLRDVVPDAPH